MARQKLSEKERKEEVGSIAAADQVPVERHRRHAGLQLGHEATPGSYELLLSPERAIDDRVAEFIDPRGRHRGNFDTDFFAPVSADGVHSASRAVDQFSDRSGCMQPVQHFNDELVIIELSATRDK